MGESLGGSQAPPSFWKVPALPQKFPNFSGSFSATSPKLSHCGINSNPGFPRTFPRLLRKFPGLPRKLPGLPRQPFSLGSPTPSPDSQKLSLSRSGRESRFWDLRELLRRGVDFGGAVKRTSKRTSRSSSWALPLALALGLRCWKLLLTAFSSSSVTAAVSAPASEPVR